MQYIIETKEKKNAYTYTTFEMPDEGVAAGKTFVIEEMWRWGKVTIESEDKPEQDDEPYKFPLYVSEYDIVDQEFDDGCSLDFVFGEGWQEAEKDYVKNLYDDDGLMSFEEHGIEFDDQEIAMYGPLTITESKE